MRTIKFLVIGVFLVILAVVYLFIAAIQRQGIDRSFWQSFATAKVVFDEDGIPTIDGATWESVIEAQGYVTASERLWQMDLLRRKAGGRLAEIFGEVAFDHDRRMRAQGREDVVDRETEALPRDERRFCEAFARGVNRFIKDHPDRWGFEYTLLFIQPEPWRCQDSLLVLLEMCDFLTSSAEKEMRRWRWSRNLSQQWRDFLFPRSHPWNRPLFGDPGLAPPLPRVPSVDEFLPKLPLDEAGASEVYRDHEPKGSNNWAWSGPSGFFLANDPHLAYSVPGLWFATRLRTSPKDWVVGASLPGIPGIVLGMTRYGAWAFTNVGEDVDDYLIETISDDKKQYIKAKRGQDVVWGTIRKRTYSVYVKGEKYPRLVEAQFTHRGPLLYFEDLGAHYSRSWLALKEGSLRLPAVELIRAKNWREFNRVIDRMRIPAQNVLYMNRSGDIGYRTSGTGIAREVTGLIPQNAVEADWLGLESHATRRRKLLRNDGKVHYLATANERIWVDAMGHSWFSDDRKTRIVELLKTGESFSREDMERFQLDTRGRFRRLIMRWLAKSSRRSETDGWADWDGDSRSSARLFAYSTMAEDLLVSQLLARVRRALIPPADRGIEYEHPLRRAWLVVLLGQAGAMDAFGTTDEDLADWIVAALKRGPSFEHHHQNRWTTQHPFVKNIPVLGKIFSVDEVPQYGAFDLVLAERPNYGPSMRLVWDLSDPKNSTWMFPVGQSGHLGSKFYKNFQKPWATGARLKVFPNPLAWDLGTSSD